ncbi:MAG: hypothetical protein O7F73_10125 [Gammaproteobacteria bacterium]|nr:hypothetical protein [Gammaproteobacteria bacterium]
MIYLPIGSCGKTVRQFAAGLCLASCAQGAAGLESVQALRYGVTLYHFYQQNYLDALSELMIGQQNGELGVHADNAELLRGGMSLSYGMDLQAQQIFTEFLAQSRQGMDRDRAWFYLAKMAWQRGEFERSATAMQNIGTLASPPLVEELNYMRVELSIRSGDYRKAQDYLALLPADSAWLPYHYYNMGAQHAAAGDWSGASQYFRNFDRLDVRNEETQSLRDRAYTASGFAFMAAGDYEQASHDFTRVRLNSPMADRALLGYGWAASEQQDYQAALSPWRTLSEQPPLSQSVRESLLAVPYAYEQLGREGVALASYQGAARVLAAELEGIRAAIEVFSSGDIEELLELRQAGADSWLFGSDILPLNPQAPYLQHLISSHSFQTAMKELRDLHQIDQRLAQGVERLQVLADVDADQQASWQRLIEQNREQQLQQRYADLLTQIAGLRDRLAIAQAEADGRALADADQLALWQRLERAAALGASLDADPGQKQRITLYRGLLVWEDNERFHELLWLNLRQLRELQALTRQTRASLERLEETVAGREHSSFSPRIEALQQRLGTQRIRVNLAINASSSEVRRVAVAELQNQARELSRSLGQSRLAIARLYDKGSIEGQP